MNPLRRARPRRRPALGRLLILLVVASVTVSCGASDEPAGPTDPPDRSSETGPSTEPSTAAPTTTASTSPTSATPATTSPPSTPVPPTAAPTTTPRPAPTTTLGGGDLAGRTIVIDPGHNGANASHLTEINQTVDAGGFAKACNTTGTATADGYPESAFNWAVATLLAERLRGLGAEVVLTRPDDRGWGPCIDERGRTAATVGADVLVSIHADGAAAGEHGFHLIRPGAVPGYTDGIVEPSAALASTLRSALVAAGFTPATYVGGDGIVARTDLGTLNHARTPAIMLEAGNMRDPAEAARLRSADTQARLADALTAGLVDHLGP